MTIQEAKEEMLKQRELLFSSTGVSKGFSVLDMWEKAYNLMEGVDISRGRSNSEMFESHIPLIH